MNRTSITAALLVLFAGCAEALAQRQYAPRNAMRAMGGYGEDGGYARTSGEDQPPVKTPLGMLLMQQDYTRVPETVLAARAALQVKAREARLKPPEKPAEPEPPANEHVPDAAPADAAPADHPAAADGEAEDPNQRPPTPEEQKQAETFRLTVVAGDWPAVAEFLKANLGEDAAGVYAFVLQSLQSDQALVPGEIISISEASPVDLRDADVDILARILQGSVQRGADPSHLALTIRNGTRFFGGADPANRARAARLLMGADLPVEAQPFLDPLDGALKDRNARLINLHVMYFDGLVKREPRAEDQQRALRRAWELCLEVLKINDAPTPERNGAAARALSYLDRVTPEEGTAFLAGAFRSEPDVAWTLVNTATTKARISRMQQLPP